jgi:hypothetical protein
VNYYQQWLDTRIAAESLVSAAVLFSPKYVSSDDNTPLPNGINEKGIIKRLEKELVARNQLFQDQENLLEQEKYM